MTGAGAQVPAPVAHGVLTLRRPQGLPAAKEAPAQARN
ncbi:hypothetical protein C4K26_3980 [Pseudomonas chlororaphis]|nr:hypothetical protein C4K26_3980 [Pseudomonas chlororaphis]